MVTVVSFELARRIASGETFSLEAFIRDGKPNEYFSFSHHAFFYSFPAFGTQWADGKICEFHKVDIACHSCRNRPERNYGGVGTLYAYKTKPGWGNRGPRLSLYCRSCREWRDSKPFENVQASQQRLQYQLSI